ncbi:3-hydroxyacyl-CoA dehydrogenase OS=Streptomyces microflavus OX=1919 GN=Smic_65940 PE=3 SV=1 [Streptomyces microflavus]
MSSTTELLKGAAELFPGEVVTQAHVRHLDLPSGAGRFALITLDNGLDHTKPTTFGPQSLANLDAAIDQVEKEASEGTITGVGITGKPFIFAVGADLKGVELLGRHEDALAIGKGGHDVFRRLSGLAVPTFAYYNGAAMGGGVEVGLHCAYRTVSTAIPAFSLPEVFLGLVPGWGGCALLPNLIGADRAVSVIIENSLNQNRQLKGKQVFELGIADAIFEGADFLEQSLIWTAAVLKGELAVERPAIDRGDAWDAAVARGRAIADSKVHGAAPAAYRALDIIAAAKDGDLSAGFDADGPGPRGPDHGRRAAQRHLRLQPGPEARQAPGRRPDKNLARPVTKVGVVGAGPDGLARWRPLCPAPPGGPGRPHGHRPGARRQGCGLRPRRDREAPRQGPHQPVDKANRLKGLVSGVLDKAEGFADADFIIEAVFEEIGVKQQVFAEVEAVAPAHAILATNTSSLSVTEMALKLKNPERVVGFHFFNPVAILPLLEIVRGEQTDDASLATAFGVARQAEEDRGPAKDAPAFVVNRSSPASFRWQRRPERPGRRGPPGACRSPARCSRRPPPDRSRPGPRSAPRSSPRGRRGRPPQRASDGRRQASGKRPAPGRPAARGRPVDRRERSA